MKYGEIWKNRQGPAHEWARLEGDNRLVPRKEILPAPLCLPIMTMFLLASNSNRYKSLKKSSIFHACDIGTEPGGTPSGTLFFEIHRQPGVPRPQPSDEQQLTLALEKIK